MRTTFLTWLCLLTLLITGGCDSVRNNQTNTGRPPALTLRHHPLANRIFDVHGNRMLDRDDFYRQLADAEYILVGETHDNTAHHRIEAQIVDRLSGLHKSASISFEMIDDQQERFIRGRDIKSADYLIALLQHTDSGWDYDSYYRNLFDSAIRGGFEILPANIERNHLIELMQDPGAEPPASLKPLLAANRLTPHMLATLQQDIVDSHCGMLGPEQAAPMVRGQQLRDAAMANSLLSSTARLRILIAGDGHVRKDLGVPIYLHAQPDKRVSIGLLEVEEDLDRPADYAADWDSDTLPFDYVWFTPRADRVDPCIAFKQSHQSESH